MDLVSNNLTKEKKYVANELNTFNKRLEIISDFQNKNQQLPDIERVKQLEARWVERVTILENINFSHSGL